MQTARGFRDLYRLWTITCLTISVSDLLGFRARLGSSARIRLSIVSGSEKV
jgi:hypothetical protein